MTTEGDVVHGLRAAAKVSGWSPSGLQKMVDVGRVPAERVGRSYTFRVVDLESIRRGRDRPAALALVPEAATSNTLARMSSLDTLAPAPGTQESPSTAHSKPMDSSTTDDHGDVASKVFADLAAGHLLTQIVVDRRLPPDVVRHIHTEWLALTDVDDAQTPTALERLGQVEAELALRAGQLDVQALADRLDAIESAVRQVDAEALRVRRNVETRLSGLERRVGAAGGGSTVADLRERLARLEAVIGGLPMALVPAAHRCPRCAGQLAMPVACACGFGAGPAA